MSNKNDEVTKSLLGSLELGARQSHGAMNVFPLFIKGQSATRYITMSRAMGLGCLVVSEIDAGGSVPQLTVVNNYDRRVLLLDGEELAGAKQNRVLNATILLRKQSKTIIPVSCTEQGRWSYTSDHFSDSDVVMNRSARARKNRSVSGSLAREGQFASDQGEVWESIEELRCSSGAESPTGAMKDIFAQRKDQLQESLDAFPLQEYQRGLLVVVNGLTVGLDFVSSVRAYAQLHKKLLSSYAMDAMITQPKQTKDAPPPHSDEEILSAASGFIKRAASSKEQKHKSVGHGWDHRFTGKGVLGSSVEYRNQTVHMAFFSEDPAPTDQQAPGMAASHRRRNYRI
jgi:hypothetical protein